MSNSGALFVGDGEGASDEEVSVLLGEISTDLVTSVALVENWDEKLRENSEMLEDASFNEILVELCSMNDDDAMLVAENIDEGLSENILLTNGAKKLSVINSEDSNGI